VQITINDPAEFNSYQLAVAKTNPAAKAAALEQFLQNYPRSAARTAALRQLIEAYRQSNQPEKASDAAKRLQPEAAN
jgi:lipopolysaccharide biosynthesis regulator YciM